MNKRNKRKNVILLPRRQKKKKKNEIEANIGKGDFVNECLGLEFPVSYGP